MAKPRTKSHLDTIPEDVLMNYYRHQYERMAKLEEQRTAITNITITLSVVTFTLGFNMASGFSKVVGFALLAIMMLSNVFAIVYIVRTDSWIKTHKLRARGILETQYGPLHTFNENTHSKYSRWSISRWKIQMYLHGLLLIVAMVMAIFLAIQPAV